MNTIDFAIDMEQEGYKYYLEQAEVNEHNELHTVFLLLAESEKEHKELLKKRKESENYTMNDFIRPDIKQVFKDLNNFRKEHSEKQLDVYRIASQQEEKSIRLYQDLLKETSEPENIELFHFLIRQEKEHLNLFEDLVLMLTRPEEWVESAEFGVREDY